MGITYCGYVYYQKSYLQPVDSIVEKSDDVRIQSEAAHICSSNSDCQSGNCYGGFCEACTLVGGPCGNDGQCCKSNCADGFCGGTAVAAGWYAGAGIAALSSAGYYYSGTPVTEANAALRADKKVPYPEKTTRVRFADDENLEQVKEIPNRYDNYEEDEETVDADAAADGETTQEYAEPYEASAEATAEADAPAIEAGAEVAAADEVALLPEEGIVALGIAETV